MDQTMDKMLAVAQMAQDPGLLNKLFFQARNLAIEAFLLRLEVRLLREGYPAQCEWKESSLAAPRIEIRMLNTTGRGSWESGQCVLRLKREKVDAPDSVSDCFFEVDSFAGTEYWRGKQPATLLAFRQTVSELYSSGYLAEEIAKLNYPFDRLSLSTF